MIICTGGGLLWNVPVTSDVDTEVGPVRSAAWGGSSPFTVVSASIAAVLVNFVGSVVRGSKRPESEVAMITKFIEISRKIVSSTMAVCATVITSVWVTKPLT